MKRKTSTLTITKIILPIILFPWLLGCDSGTNSELQASRSTTATSADKTDPTISLSQTCSNDRAGYQINYPQDWQTNPGEVLNRCQVFDPQSATVPENTESTGKAIYLRIEANVPFERIATENRGERHLSRQRMSIGDYRAVAIESESTGKALLPQGIRTYSYVVALDKGTLVAITYDLGSNEYQTNKQILDRMMETIEFNDRP
ncbi:hypothetical protein [Myxosarcina sp. GI1(2024)]